MIKLNEWYDNYDKLMNVILFDIRSYLPNFDNNTLIDNDMIFLFNFYKYESPTIQDKNTFERYVKDWGHNIYLTYYLKSKAEQDLLKENFTNDLFKTISTNKAQANGTTKSENISQVSNSLSDNVVSFVESPTFNQLPLNDLQKNNLKNALEQNTISTSEVVNLFNIYLQRLNTQITNGYQYLTQEFNRFFVRIETTNYDNLNFNEDIEYLTTFRSGEHITEVDYLGLENKNNIINNDKRIRYLENQNRFNIQNIDENTKTNVNQNLQIQKLQENNEFLNNKIDNLKTLDNLVCGDNLTQQPQGDKEVFINTVDDLTINSLSSRNGVLEMRDETHFKDTAHFENGIVSENNTKDNIYIYTSSDGISKVIASDTMFLGDKEGVVNLRDILNNIKQLQEEQKSDLNFVGEITISKTYKLGDFGYVKNKWYICNVDSADGDVSNKTNWKETSSQTDIPSLDNYYTKPEINGKLQTINTNIQHNAGEINDLKLKHNLVNERLDAMDNNQEFTTSIGNQWEESLVFAELNPDEPNKTKLNLKPSTMKEYWLKNTIETQRQKIKSIENTIDNIITADDRVFVQKVFWGQENKGEEPRIYGYSTTYGTIPLQRQFGVRTFGNIFNVDYQDWEGVLYNGQQIPFGTKNDSVGIDLTNGNFTSSQDIKNVELYKYEITNGITKTHFDLTIGEVYTHINNNDADINKKIKDLVSDVYNRTKIINLPSEIYYIEKIVKLNTGKLSKTLIFNDFDISKCVNIDVWIKRSNIGPWMKIANEDSSGGVNPYTLEVTSETGVGQLWMYRLLETNADLWVEAKISVIYKGMLD